MGESTAACGEPCGSRLRRQRHAAKHLAAFEREGHDLLTAPLGRPIEAQDQAVALGAGSRDNTAGGRGERDVAEVSRMPAVAGKAPDQAVGDERQPENDQNAHADDQTLQRPHTPHPYAGSDAGTAPTPPSPASMTADEPLTYTVTAIDDDAHDRLDRVLARHLPALSRSRLKALIESGYVSCGGATIVEPADRVKSGAAYEIAVPAAAPAAPAAQAIALDIRYEDDDLIVLNKPAGLVVHPAPGNPDRTLVNALLAHCGDGLPGIGGVRRPGIVHRLDKDTSGLMVAAKTETAYHGLARQFAAREVERSYRALVWGRPEPSAGEIVSNIGRSPQNRKKMASVARGGKMAVTRYRVLRSFAGGAVSLVECRLMTGRTHQIRVHMAERGHALLGDPTYGRTGKDRLRRLGCGARAAVGALGRQALHARTLGFTHPTTGVPLRFEAELPQDLKDLTISLERL